MLTVLIRYQGEGDNARKFVEEMTSSGLVKQIQKLREKYDLHMKVEKYKSILDEKDERFIRR